MVSCAVLLHITSDEEWRDALQSGVYRPKGFAREGFVHCSHLGQVLGVANRLFRNINGLVLLQIDPAKLTVPVREENLEGGTEQYPHVYGPLSATAVVAAYAFPWRPDGFALPEELSRQPS